MLRVLFSTLICNSVRRLNNFEFKMNKLILVFLLCSLLSWSNQQRRYYYFDPYLAFYYPFNAFYLPVRIPLINAVLIIGIIKY